MDDTSDVETGLSNEPMNVATSALSSFCETNFPEASPQKTVISSFGDHHTLPVSCLEVFEGASPAPLRAWKDITEVSISVF